MEVTGGNGILIAGLVIGGNGPKTVLVRGVGPALSEFGVAGASRRSRDHGLFGHSRHSQQLQLGDRLKHRGADHRGGGGGRSVPLPSGSKDAALLLTLNPGPYTVEVTSASNANGVALIEVYDTQP